MPGLDLFGSETTVPTSTVVEVPAPAPVESTSSGPGVYYNARLDPKNFLEGPLSTNAATRLRQMLARPGIVVRVPFLSRVFPSADIGIGRTWYLRRHQRPLRS